jgi:hypothetical protein
MSHDDHRGVQYDVTLSSVERCSQLHVDVMMAVSRFHKIVKTPLRPLVMLLSGQTVAF